MAQKKTFKAALNNPAMQFISAPAPEETLPEKGQELLQNAEKPAKKTAPKPQKTAENASETIVSSKQTVPDGYKINPLYVEVKSKRVQLVLQPSLFEKVKKLAKNNGDSVNNTIHAILEQATLEE